MKHNNVLPNAHFKKDWDRRVKTWFDQAGQKRRRRLLRKEKAAAIAPRPAAGLPLRYAEVQHENQTGSWFHSSGAEGVFLFGSACNGIGGRNQPP